jgi:O-antigen/teichoic acid export membrane protein
VIGLWPIMVSMALVFLRNQPVNPTSAQMRRLFSFGSWIMVTAIIGPLMTMADRLVIGGVFGAAAVVAYSVPVQIASRTVMFPMAIVQALFPRLASNAEQDSVALGKVSVVLVGQLYAFVVVGLICLAAPLLDLWLGGDLDPRSVLVGQITLIGIWINALANVPYALIQARGNPRYTAVLHLIELPIYFALLYGLGVAFGLYGVALAFTLRVVLDCAALFQKAEFLVSSVLGRLAGPGTVIFAAFATSMLIQDWMQAIMAAAFYCALLIALTWFQMPIEAKNWLTERLRA